MTRTAAISAAVVTFGAGLCSLYAFFVGTLIWANGNGAVQAVFGGLLVMFFFLLSGIFVCNAIWPSRPNRPARDPWRRTLEADELERLKAEQRNHLAGLPRDFQVETGPNDGFTVRHIK